jgi:hypothetical protein
VDAQRIELWLVSSSPWPFTNYGAAALALNTTTASDNKRHLMWTRAVT